VGVALRGSIMVEAVVVAPAPVLVRAPASENGLNGTYVDDVGSILSTGRPLTNGRVPGRRGPSFSELSVIRWPP